MTTLAAADAEDLEILSARLQDAVGKLQDFVWLPKQRRFAALVNRYRWEEGEKHNGTRVRAGLHFDSVLKVESRNIKRGAPDAVVDLLAIAFTPNGGEDPGRRDRPATGRRRRFPPHRGMYRRPASGFDRPLGRHRQTRA